MNEGSSVHQNLDIFLSACDLKTISRPLLDYLSLLDKWNKAYNLTAVRTLDGMMSKHLFDSLAILPWLKGTHILDVGTGAGLPGIPLAIARPQCQFVLLDSNGKKIRFLKEVKRQLNLPNIDIVQIRVENYHRPEGFDTVVSRAFSTMQQMIEWTQHLIANQGRWLAMKGRYPQAELDTLLQPYQVEEYKVPGVEGERCCILIDNIHKE